MSPSLDYPVSSWGNEQQEQKGKKPVNMTNSLVKSTNKSKLPYADTLWCMDSDHCVMPYLIYMMELMLNAVSYQIVYNYDNYGILRIAM